MRKSGGRANGPKPISSGTPSPCWPLCAARILKLSGARSCAGLGWWPQGSNRVIRGGSWNNDASNCASANRNNNNPSNRNNNNGFRVVLAPAHLRGQLAARLNRTPSRPG
ncbi:MAG: SUMF1/EgtB/PvdO family nonheme iron enzyme [Verrucomicrobiota bacterium]